MEQQVVSLWAGTQGKLDPVPVEDISRFEEEFLDYVKRSHEGIFTTIRETAKFDDDTASSLESAYTSFLEQFETSEGGRISVGREEFDALDDEDVEQEQIVKQKRG